MTKIKSRVPALRFPEFEGEWNEKRLGKVLIKQVDPVDVAIGTYYSEIGIRSHGKGLFYKEPILGKDLGNKRVFWIKEEAFIVNIVFAWEQAVAKTTEKEKGMIASHRFPMYIPKKDTANVDYILHFFLTRKGKRLLELASPGGAGRNKTLGQKEFEKLSLTLPLVSEQTKIANFLTSIDDQIQLLKLKKDKLEAYKRGVMQQIFSQKLRFKDENGDDYMDWEYISLGKILNYEQPTKYLVESTEYEDSFETPVLTAGKTFILGYTDETFGIFSKNLPVIIFDDFTTAMKFVNFPFKAKSSAMKILKPKKNSNIRYVYEAMQTIEYNIGGHGRHWISVYSQIEIPYPSPTEQQRIATFLSAINDKITLCDDQITKSQKYKDALLQQMFV